MNVFQSQIVGYDINVSKTFMMVILIIEDSMRKVLEGIVLVLMCPLVLKIIVYSQKEKFNKRHREDLMISNTHVRRSATNLNCVRVLK
jgi:hypothetical protein